MSAGYVSLYRKYRPQTFDDVVEQKHIISTLKNQIKSNPELENALWNCEFVFDENGNRTKEYSINDLCKGG